MERIIIFLVALVLGLIVIMNPYSVLSIVSNNNNNYLIVNNLENESINFTFNREFITDYYNSEDYYLCLLNLYIDEFKNNETIENIESVQWGNCYYNVNDLSYTMSFILDENCLYDGDEQQILINKTGGLMINRVEIEYYGVDYKYKFLLNLIIMMGLLIIFAAILFIGWN